jgi:phosphoglycerate dehydrogenase-like enzyme
MPDRPTVVFARMSAFTEHLFEDSHYERLGAVCDVVDPVPLESFHDERAEQLLPRAEILVTGWGCPRIGSRVLALAPDLRLVVHAAGTIRDLVTDSFWAADIPLISAADANAVPVAEFTLGAILLANKRAFTIQRLYRDARDYRQWDHEVPAMGNRGKTVGVIGASRIGRRVIALLAPFDLDVLLSDPFVDPDDAIALGVELVDLDELLARADVVTLHAPLLPERFSTWSCTCCSRYSNSTSIPAARSSIGRATPSSTWCTKPRKRSASSSGKPSIRAITRTGMCWAYSAAASTTLRSPISAMSSLQ